MGNYILMPFALVEIATGAVIWWDVISLREFDEYLESEKTIFTMPMFSGVAMMFPLWDEVLGYEPA